MIAPQVPTGGLIGQAILDDESHGQRNDAMGVVSSRQGVVGHVRVKVFATARATMLRVDEVNVARTPRNQVAHVVKDTSACSAAETGFVTTRTGAMREVASAMNDLGFGQIFGSRDAFRGIRQILSRARHGNALLGQLV
jgi:esterase/lipase superfamily enzyme